MTAELSGSVKIAESAGFDNHLNSCLFASSVHGKQQFVLPFKRFVAPYQIQVVLMLPCSFPAWKTDEPCPENGQRMRLFYGHPACHFCRDEARMNVLFVPHFPSTGQHAALHRRRQADNRTDPCIPRKSILPSLPARNAS